MFYKFTLYIALAVFVIGLIYNVSNWFRFSIGVSGRNITPWQRVMAAIKGIFGVLFSQKLVTLGKVFISDVLLQRHILKEDVLRWTMHILIFASFMFLLIFHAFDRILVTPLFNKYYLALNPWLIIFGLILLSGLCISLYRRYILKVSRLKTTAMDVYAIMILLVIVLSGILMETTKLSSYNYYQKIWYVHIAVCFFGLAYLPFSKMFHIFTTPLSLLVNGVMDENSDPANIATRQVMELDGCTHCNTCSKHCSVAVAYDSLGNSNILPSERMSFLKDYILNKKINKRKLKGIQEGIYLCTNCDRCTVVCPAGINLRELWFGAREELVERGIAVDLLLTPFSYFRGLNRKKIDSSRYDIPLDTVKKVLTNDYAAASGTADKPIVLSPENKKFHESIGLSGRTDSFVACFSCENCTTVCPVVTNYEDPQKSLDLLPHQIIRSMALGLKEMATGSRMLWNCLTCYQCQEHCPQGVKVTDIFNKLRTITVEDNKFSA